MTTISTSLVGSLGVPDAARGADARAAEEAVATQLRNLAQQGRLPVGATITARYVYKVGPDGALVPTETQLSARAVGDETSGRGASQRGDGRGPSLQDLTQPKAALSPSEELALFASDAGAAGTPIMGEGHAPTAAPNAALPNAETANASATQAPTTPSPEYVAANVYARNNDVVYHTSPIADFAA